MSVNTGGSGSDEQIAAKRQEPINVREAYSGDFDLERELRHEWWMNHACEVGCQYGDDGEMWCNRFVIDFKRTPINELRGRVMERRLARAAEVAS